MARVRTDSIFQVASRTRIQTRESECRSPAVSTHGKIQSITKRSGAREVNSVRVTQRAFCLTETSVTCAVTAMRSSSAGSGGWFVRATFESGPVSVGLRDSVSEACSLS